MSLETLVKKLFGGSRRRRSARKHRGGGKCSTLNPAPYPGTGGGRRRRGGRRSARRQRGGVSRALHPAPYGSGSPLAEALGSGNFGPRHAPEIAGGWSGSQGGPLRGGRRSRRGGRRSRRGGRKSHRRGRKSHRRGRKSHRRGRKSHRRGRKSRRRHTKRGGLSSQLVPIGLVAGLLGMKSKKRKKHSRRHKY